MILGIGGQETLKLASVQAMAQEPGTFSVFFTPPIFSHGIDNRLAVSQTNEYLRRSG
ncbi:MAG: hypothetical protein RLZZ490_2321 [Cyanobacteriota bacterium]